MKIALAQIDTTVGDFKGNLDTILDYLRRAAKQKAQLAVFPELTLTGYPPKDLLERPDFLAAQDKAFRELARRVGETACIVGFVDRAPRGAGKPLANAAALLHRGRVLGIKHKGLLPTYDVFDEERYFEPGGTAPVFDFRGERLGISVCEDIWHDADYWGNVPYPQDPVLAQVKAGANLLINISASPFSRRKQNLRGELLRRQARKYKAPLVYVNLVGGNDDLVFDGGSMVVDARGRVAVQLPHFREELRIVDTRRLRPSRPPALKDEAMVLDALILGLRDYARKCGFTRAALGLSGGIDSALTAWIAAAALGPRNVLGVSMPSPYSSPGSLVDAKKLAERLGIEYRVHPIGDVFAEYKKNLGFLRDKTVDKTLQNIQARIRGNILMAISNREGPLVLSTGNKSEMSVGYGTLYGDMAGGLALISDIPKTLVYRLSREANRRKNAIPKSCFTKPPSAELAPGQTDQDDLPSYEVLDGVLERYIEGRMDPKEIVAQGFDKKIVEDILRRLDANEYKRGQLPPGIRVTARAFGYGWRFPISSRYRVKL